MSLSAFLKEPSLHGLQPGTQRFFEAQKTLIRRRRLLKRCYDDWYERLLKDARSGPLEGKFLELGSGGSYLAELEPGIITSDVVEGVAERVIDARKLPFPDKSLRALLLTHVFHHIPDADAFFREAQRALAPGGVISMIEVAHTPFARFFFRRFHHEPYDDARREWTFSQNDSMMDSNQALSWIVFVRDRAQFEQRYPELSIETLELTAWLTYFVSGGVTGRCMVPKFLEGPMIGLEWLLTPLRPLFALHWHIRLRKRNSPADIQR